MIRAAIDIGTNSVKISVLKLQGRRIRSLREAAVLCRPGEGVRASGRIGRAALARTVAQVGRYVRAAKRLGDPRPIVFATEWMRRVDNRRAFLDRLDVPCAILSARKEAEYSYRGVRTLLGIEAPMLDLGGGSAELLVGSRGRLRRWTSMPLGAVFLTERHVRHDPPTGKELEAIDRVIGRRLRRIPKKRSPVVVGIGGSVAALAFSRAPERRFEVEGLNGMKIRRGSLATLERKLAAVPTKVRVRRFKLDPGRADVIVAGARLLLAFMDWAGARTLVASTYGARHGAILEEVGRRPDSRFD
jgi:exopolyphosphatase/guanosine-5'-triphosphate,3'-diphosphate pyrophosphatase